MIGKPNLNNIYVHPLFIVAVFILHTALSVLFALYVAPTMVTLIGVSVTVAALLWIVIGLIIFSIALYLQSTMEVGILDE